MFDAIIDHVTGMFSCHNTTLIIPQGYMEKGHRKYSIPLGVKKFLTHVCYIADQVLPVLAMWRGLCPF